MKAQMQDFLTNEDLERSLLVDQDKWVIIYYKGLQFSICLDWGYLGEHLTKEKMLLMNHIDLKWNQNLQVNLIA